MAIDLVAPMMNKATRSCDAAGRSKSTKAFSGQVDMIPVKGLRSAASRSYPGSNGTHSTAAGSLPAVRWVRS
jgi:hypothetical protein